MTIFRQRYQRVQHIMQLIGIAHIRPGFFAHLRNRRRIEASDFFEHRFRQHPPHLHGARPPLFERRVVQIGIRIRIQNLVRKLRRNRRIDRNAANSSVRHAAAAATSGHRYPSPR